MTQPHREPVHPRSDQLTIGPHLSPPRGWRRSTCSCKLLEGDDHHGDSNPGVCWSERLFESFAALGAFLDSKTSRCSVLVAGCGNLWGRRLPSVVARRNVETQKHWAPLGIVPAKAAPPDDEAKSPTALIAISISFCARCLIRPRAFISGISGAPVLYAVRHQPFAAFDGLISCFVSRTLKTGATPRGAWLKPHHGQPSRRG